MRRVAAVSMSLALVFASCSSDEDDTTTTVIATTITTATTTAAPTTTTTTTAAPTTTTAVTTTTTTLPPNIDAGLALPRGATYAHVVFTFTGSEYSNATPGTYLEDDPRIEEDRYLYLRFAADFEPDYPGRSEDFDVADFALLLADGTSITADEVDFRRTIAVTASRPPVSALAFPGDELDLDGAVVVFDNDINEPMVIPLDGPQPADPYPILVLVDATGAADYEGGCTATAGTVKILDAEWDVDGGVDQDGDTIVRAGTHRTIEGERFVRIRLQAIAGGGTCGGTVLTDDAFRLAVDGLPLGSVNSFAMLLNAGEGVEIIFGYRVPVDTEELVLDVGVVDGLVASFPITVPAELP